MWTMSPKQRNAKIKNCLSSDRERNAQSGIIDRVGVYIELFEPLESLTPAMKLDIFLKIQ